MGFFVGNCDTYLILPLKPEGLELQQPRATPWVEHHQQSQALKGRSSDITFTNQSPGCYFCLGGSIALTGLEYAYVPQPRALPWAIEVPAFQA